MKASTLAFLIAQKQACASQSDRLKSLIEIEAQNSLSTIIQLLSRMVGRVLDERVLEAEAGRAFKTRVIDAILELREAESLLNSRVVSDENE